MQIYILAFLEFRIIIAIERRKSIACIHPKKERQNFDNFLLQEKRKKDII